MNGRRPPKDLVVRLFAKPLAFRWGGGVATKKYIYVPFCSYNNKLTTKKNIYILFCR
jgi:hypothetical protein